MKRIWLKMLGAALLCIWTFGSSADAAEKIRIAVTNFNITYLSAAVAAQKVFFATKT